MHNVSPRDLSPTFLRWCPLQLTSVPRPMYRYRNPLGDEAPTGFTGVVSPPSTPWPLLPCFLSLKPDEFLPTHCASSRTPLPLKLQPPTGPGRRGSA